MLYVFHVDVGRLLSFDMTVALSSVENLKDTIERLHGIPASNIVLLVSGGEMLTQTTQVSFYSAGTDTNPIYMFVTGENARLPPPNSVPLPAQINEPDIDLRKQVDECLNLPAVLETVERRAHLARCMFELARKEESLCERLVHEQHLQQQGWSAVVANMEDLTNEFHQRFRNFCKFFDRHLLKCSSYLELLHNFNDDLTKLARIPILPALMSLAEADFHGFDELLDNDDVFPRQEANTAAVMASSSDEKDTTTTSLNVNNNTTSIADEKDVDMAAGSSTTSDDKTSPNKKQKMATETTEEEQQQQQIQLQQQRISQTSTSSSSARRNNLNLLQWITSKENHDALKLMSAECIQGLGTFNQEIYEKLKFEVESLIKLAEQGDVKEIKGLGERLCRLEEIKYNIKKMVQDQKELSTAFQQNHNRAQTLRDSSILPDLCASHQSQLIAMLKNHQKIRDHCRCIAKAKDELGTNLHTRLKHIIRIENAMSDFDSSLLFYHRCLRRAERHINIIEQIHQAPCIYVAAVTEVVRRKIFSSEFRQWASKLADDFEAIHCEEIRRREAFNESFEGHFLNILFPGMTDMPPAFANENPLIFDARLPNLTRSDISLLTSHLPELTPELQLPDMGHVINFFVSRSGEHQRERMEELLKQQVAAALNMTEKQPIQQHQRLGELQRETTTIGCDESETTDTETEFEQVNETEGASCAADLTVVIAETKSVGTSMTASSLGQQLEQIARSTTTDPVCILQSAGTMTDDNEQSIRAEVERMRDFIGAMSKLAMNCLRMARANLASFRGDAENYREELQSELQMFNEKWSVIRMQCAKQHDDELQRLNILLLQRDDALATQNAEAKSADIKYATAETQLEELRNQLKLAEVQREKAINEACELLIHEHKTELESLRCRFKLMTSMERTPSDPNLEKTCSNCEQHAGQSIDVVQHELLLAQLRAQLEAEKEQAISSALEAERSIWQSKIFPMNSESVMANASILKDMLEDKERQLDQLREQDKMLTKENFQLKMRLDALTNEEGNSWLKEKIDYLNRDKCRLEEELTMEKSKRLEMETSIAEVKFNFSTYETCMPASFSRSKSSGSSQKMISIESLAKGDIVFVVWSIRYRNFMIFQNSYTLYFVHGDSLRSLNLQMPQLSRNDDYDETRIPVPFNAIGIVYDKEYCQARKEKNRYHVSKNTKFYRVKVVPLYKKAGRDPAELISASISRSKSQTEMPTERIITVIGGNNIANKDVVDEGAVGGIATNVGISNYSSIGSSIYQSFKERTTSITTVAEEDEEPISLLSDRCRYISVSEEDESLLAAADLAEELQMQQQQQKQQQLPQQQQKQSVITEQPTASSKLKLDLLLASTDITTTTNTITTTTTKTNEPTTPTTPTATTAAAIETTTNVVESNTLMSNTAPTITDITTPSESCPVSAITEDLTTLSIFVPRTDAVVVDTPNITSIPISIPMSTCTISEDSDEYRSLEAKDETDFPISE